MKIYLLHPRGAPNRPEVACASRADLPIYSMRDDETVELDVPMDVVRLRVGLRALYSVALTLARNSANNASAVNEQWQFVQAEFEKLTGESL